MPDSAAYSGPLAQGDVIYCQSHESSLPYIAMIERCEGPQLVCRWFYRHSELPTKLLSATKSENTQHELYLSTHKDKNTRESVLGLCHVEFDGPVGLDGAYLCRNTFDTLKKALVPLHTAEWTVGGASGSLLAPDVAAQGTVEKRKNKLPPVVRLANSWSHGVFLFVNSPVPDVGMIFFQGRSQKLQKNETV